MPWRQFAASLLFWVVLLGLKGAFDWFFVIKPLEGPIKALWNRGWLSSCEGRIRNGECAHDPTWNRCTGLYVVTLRERSTDVIFAIRCSGLVATLQADLK